MQTMKKESNETLVALYQAESDKAAKSELLGRLYQDNINLVMKIANRYTAYADFDDLTQEGFFGFKVACDMFDVDQKASFLNYASIWLKQAMMRYIENNGSSVRFPVNKQQSVFKLKKIINQYMMQFGEEPSDKELCCLLGVDQVTLEKLKLDEVKLKVRSLDVPISSDDDSFSLGDTIADDRDDIGDVIQIEYNERLSLILWDEVNKLSPREGQVIIKRFKEEKTLEQIGSDMGITPEGVRCIQATAMRKLRQSKIIKQYREDIISHAYIGTGLTSFRNTGTSSTEKTAILLYQRGLDKYIKYLEKDITRIEKKYSIELDGRYRQLKIDEYKRTHPMP